MTARLLKVIVQPVYVVDQGDELIEVPVQPIPMSAAEWKRLDPEVWAKDGAMQVENQFTAEPEKSS